MYPNGPLEIQFEKKKSLFFFSLTAFFLTAYLSQFSLTLSIFSFSFACSHSRSSSRLTLSSHFGTSLLYSPIFTGRMASLFISSSFPSFLPSTLFTSSHNKYKPLSSTLLPPKSLSSALIGRMAFACFFSFVFSVCKTLRLTSH